MSDIFIDIWRKNLQLSVNIDSHSSIRHGEWKRCKEDQFLLASWKTIPCSEEKEENEEEAEWEEERHRELVDIFKD